MPLHCRECIAGTRISCSSCYSGYTLRILDANTNTGRIPVFLKLGSDRVWVAVFRFGARGSGLEFIQALSLFLKPSPMFFDIKF